MTQIKLRTLEDDERIVEPGAYRVDLQRYHSGELCDVPAITSSGLRTIDLSCPAEYWARSVYNPARLEREETPALSLGRAAHSLLLGDEVFEEHFAVEPDLDGMTADQVFKTKDDVSAWLRARGVSPDGTLQRLLSVARRHGCEVPHKTELMEAWSERLEGRTPISPTDYRRIEGMAESLHRHPLVKAGLFEGLVEPTLVIQHGTIAVMSRPDVLPTSGTAADLKTIRAVNETACRREIAAKGYDMQLALAAQAAHELFGVKTSAAAICFVQSVAPFHTMVVEVDPEALHVAALRNVRAMERFEAGIRTGEWPGYDDQVFRLLPGQSETVRDRIAAGELPSLGAEDVGIQL